MSFSFDKRGCHVGGHINGRSESHGDEPVSAADIKISGIMLDKDELNTLCDDDEMYRSLFITKGRLVEPRAKVIDNVFYGVFKYKKSPVTLYVGPDLDAVKLLGCTVAKIVLEPRTGGLTEMSMQVQGNPTPDQVAQLWPFMDNDASISARFGKAEIKVKDQPQLPLGDKTEDDDEPTLGKDEVPGPLDKGGAEAH